MPSYETEEDKNICEIPYSIAHSELFKNEVLLQTNNEEEQKE